MLRLRVGPSAESLEKPMNSDKRTLTTEDGSAYSVYAAGPPDSRRGILILHEWWGVKAHNRQWAERFAALGYRALLVDLYDGRVTDDPQQAGEWMRDLDQQSADSKLLTALDSLEAPGRLIATYGCSFGGKQAMRASLLHPAAVAATVLAYCRMESNVQKLRTLQSPVLAIYAKQERTWPEKQHAFEAAMAEAGKVTESVVYDAAHGFTNPESPRYDAEAELDAWRVTLEFLDRQLKPTA